MTSDVGPWSLVPEWITDADVSDRALRLYVVLGRYANSDGECWPKRKTLAERLRCSLNSLDRAKEELAAVGALTWDQQAGDDQVLGPNRYVLHYVPPCSTSPLVGRGSPTRGARGSPTTGAGNESQLELDPSTKGSTAVPSVPPSPIQALVAGYINDVRAVENGHQPAQKWKLAAGRAIKVALDDGETPEVIATCLGLAAREGKNPSTLAHIISDYHARRPRRTPRP